MDEFEKIRAFSAELGKKTEEAVAAENGTSGEVKTEEDYRIFMNDIQKGKQMIMTIEVKEESNLDIKSCSSSILNYVEKNKCKSPKLSPSDKKDNI